MMDNIQNKPFSGGTPRDEDRRFQVRYSRGDTYSGIVQFTVQVTVNGGDYWSPLPYLREEELDILMEKLREIKMVYNTGQPR